jgi:hypothetical protein
MGTHEKHGRPMGDQGFMKKKTLTINDVELGFRVIDMGGYWYPLVPDTYLVRTRYPVPVLPL